MSYVSSKLVAFFTSDVSLELVVFLSFCICDILLHFFLYIQSDVFPHNCDKCCLRTIQCC
eukprot:UN02287